MWCRSILGGALSIADVLPEHAAHVREVLGTFGCRRLDELHDTLGRIEAALTQPGPFLQARSLFLNGSGKNYPRATLTERRPMATKVQVIFYSMYGHVYHLAQAIAGGARTVAGVEATLARVPETLPDEILAKMGALDAKGMFADVPTADPHALADADAILLGTPTRYGLPTAQMQSFLDATGSLWARGALIGKVGGAFTSTASQHGGQETTLVHLHTFFYHQGMVVAGVPYSTPELTALTEISGGSPYGASTIAGPRGERQPTAAELAIARAQEAHAARIAAKLAAG